MRRIYVGETCYLKNTGQEIQITDVDDWAKPFKYRFKDSDVNFVYCLREELCLRKPK